MKLYIKNIVSNRCKIIVKSELEILGLHFIGINFCEVEIMENISEEQLSVLNERLNESGFSLISERNSILIEKIKAIIIELVHYSENQIAINLSDYLSLKLNLSYTYMANLFSKDQGITIEQFLLTHKVERIKGLLIYSELNISEIADKLHYSSIAHLSNQFKKMTGLSPSEYKQQKLNQRKELENVRVHKITR